MQPQFNQTPAAAKSGARLRISFRCARSWTAAVGVAAGLWAQACDTRAAGTNASSAITNAPERESPSAQSRMPDPLVLENGESIVTPAAWDRRREEVKRILEVYFTGSMPPPPANITGVDILTRPVLNGTVNFRRVHLAFGPTNCPGFDVGIFTPTAGDKPFPTFVQPSFFPTPGDALLPGKTSAGAAGVGTTNGSAPTAASNAPLSSAMRKRAEGMGDAETAAKSYQELFRRGYAVVTYDYRQCGADRRDCRNSGFFPAYPGFDWGELAAWAWGMSRVVDYLETQPFADKGRLIATGHSRLGKAALIAGAFDRRFAMVAPVGSGCGGTAAFRFSGMDRDGKEGLYELAKNVPQWLSPRLPAFAGHVEDLPFDQDWLIALVAPRPFLSAEALNDQFSDANAVKQSWLAAKPVYVLLGEPGNLGVSFRPGVHMFNAEDWVAILDFADAKLRGMSVHRDFDQFPTGEQLR